jgi:peptidoglycan/LPS O-acetylase OafA/YrhL
LTTPYRGEAGEPRSAGHGGRAALGGGTIIGLDVARFLAALGVVLYHYAFFSWHEPFGATGLRAAIGIQVAYPALLPLSWWGWVGVEIFFVISGLVICLSAEHQSSAAFLRNRVLRIAPALWFFATISLLVTFLYSSATVEAALPMYLRSIVLFPRGPWIDGVYWTLTVEAVFYALICLLILSGWITRLRLIVFAASMLVLGFYLMVLAARAWPELSIAGPVLAAADAYISRPLLLTTGAYFLVGANLYLLSRDGWSASGAAALAASLAAGTAGLWISAENSAAVQFHGRSPATPALIWLAFVTGLGFSLVHHRSGRRSAGMQSVARSAGLASYPLYLFHNIGGAFLFGLLLGFGISAYPALLLAISLCVAVSVGFAIWVEPALRRWLAHRLPRGADHLATSVSTSPVKGWDRT